MVIVARPEGAHNLLLPILLAVDYYLRRRAFLRFQFATHGRGINCFDERGEQPELRINHLEMLEVIQLSLEPRFRVG